MYKLVPEHINEVINFERKQNKMTSLGVGKIHLIKSWLDEMGVTKYIINDDLTIDVNSNVYLSFKNLNKFPSFIKFNKVSEDFTCHHNNLTSLEGCPTLVGGYFSCSNSNLTSLEGCPTSVDGDFYCFDNKRKFTEDEIRKYCKVKGNIYV